MTSEDKPIGRSRGGKFSTTPGGKVRKPAYISPDEAKLLRDYAHQEGLSESEVIGLALRVLFRLEPHPDSR